MFLAVLALGLIGSQPSISGRHDNVQTSAQPLVLRQVLYQLGKKCGCYFTLEQAHSGNQTLGQMEGTPLPQELLAESPQQVMDHLTRVVPNFTYQVDKVDARVIHIIDARVLSRAGYLLDQYVGPLEYDGKLEGLVTAMAKQGIRVSPKAFLTIGTPDDLVDYHTVVHVRVNSASVRTVLTAFMPLEEEMAGKLLWIARPNLDDPKLETTVHFPFAPKPDKNTVAR
jgi:hypothetical protein